MIKSSIDKATGFEKRFEKIGTVVYDNSTAASKAVAKAISDLIRVSNWFLSKRFVCRIGAFA